MNGGGCGVSLVYVYVREACSVRATLLPWYRTLNYIVDTPHSDGQHDTAQTRPTHNTHTWFAPGPTAQQGRMSRSALTTVGAIHSNLPRVID